MLFLGKYKLYYEIAKINYENKLLTFLEAFKITLQIQYL